jgi:hypothetical protein
MNFPDSSGPAEPYPLTWRPDDQPPSCDPYLHLSGCGYASSPALTARVAAVFHDYAAGGHELAGVKSFLALAVDLYTEKAQDPDGTDPWPAAMLALLEHATRAANAPYGRPWAVAGLAAEMRGAQELAREAALR